MIEAAAFSDLQPLLRAHSTLVLVAKAEDVLQGLPPDRLALPLEEAERIARYRIEADRQARRAAHGLVRHCLGELLARSPQELHFIRDDKGRPFLAGMKGLDFNISHGGSWIAVGLSSTGRVGVDVQESSDTFDWNAVARGYLCKEEIEALQRLPLSNQATTALEIWCLKEAFLKASGEGLATPPHQLRPQQTQAAWRLSHKSYELKAATSFLADGTCTAWACESTATPHVIRI